MRIKIVEVVTESITKGKNSYQMATVAYRVAGNSDLRNQKLISFANPDSFAAMQKANPGDEYDVEVTKNAAGYNQWASVKAASAGDAPQPETKASTYKPSSNYETKEERTQRQLHIVRQSSLSNAVNTLSVGAKVAPDPEAVIALAQRYVEFVYSDDAEEILGKSVNNFEDVPV